MTQSSDRPRITVDRDGHVLLIGLDRADKRNAADFRLLQELSLAYAELENDPELRAGLVYAHGEHFTGGLDLADVGPRIGADGLDITAEGTWEDTEPRTFRYEDITRIDVGGRFETALHLLGGFPPVPD